MTWGSKHDLMTTQTPLRGRYPPTSALRVPLASLTDVCVLVLTSLCGGGNGGVNGTSSVFISHAPRSARSKDQVAPDKGDLGAPRDELHRKRRLTATDERRIRSLPMVNKGRRKADT